MLSCYQGLVNSEISHNLKHKKSNTQTNTITKMSKILFISLAWSTMIYVSVMANSLPECRNIENSKKYVASESDCSKYIFCDGVNSFEGECLDENSFNELEGNCVEAHEVECKTNVVANVGSAFAPDQVGHEIGRNDVTVDVLTNVNDGLVMLNSKPSVNTATSLIPLSTSWQNQLAITSAPKCPLVFGISNVIHLPNPDSYSSYFTCYNGITVPMICAHNMYFNAQTSKCQRLEQVQCASNRLVRLQCSRGIYNFIPHPRNCEYYYLCANGFLMIMQCPLNFAWHYENRVCVRRSQAKCFSKTILQTMLLDKLSSLTL